MTFNYLLELRDRDIEAQGKHRQELWDEGHADAIANNPPSSDEDAYLKGYGAAYGIYRNRRNPNPYPFLNGYGEF